MTNRVLYENTQEHIFLKVDKGHRFYSQQKVVISFFSPVTIEVTHLLFVFKGILIYMTSYSFINLLKISNDLWERASYLRILSLIFVFRGGSKPKFAFIG